jgi:hypothetical protein
MAHRNRCRSRSRSRSEAGKAPRWAAGALVGVVLALALGTLLLLTLAGLTAGGRLELTAATGMARPAAALGCVAGALAGRRAARR